MQALTTINKTVRLEVIKAAAEELNEVLSGRLSICTDVKKMDILLSIQECISTLKSSVNLSDETISLLKKMGWEKPHPVQQKRIEPITREMALIECAEYNVVSVGNFITSIPQKKSRICAAAIALQESGSSPESLNAKSSEIFAGWGGKYSEKEQVLHTDILLKGVVVIGAANIPYIKKEIKSTQISLNRKTRAVATALAVQERHTTREALINRCSEIYTGWGKKEHSKNTAFYVNAMLEGLMTLGLLEVSESGEVHYTV